MRHPQAIRNLIDRLDLALGRKMDPETRSVLIDARDEIQTMYAGALLVQQHLNAAKKMGEGGFFEMHQECAKARQAVESMIGAAA